MKEVTFQHYITQKDISLLLPLPRISQWIRLSYFRGRAIDDIIDWDAELPATYKDIPEFIQAVAEDIVQNRRQESLTTIGKAVIKMIESYKKHGKDIQPHILDFLDAMIIEYNRRTLKQLLTEEQLINLHDKSFRSAHDIFLYALWSKNNAKDIVELPQILWQLYWIKDLHNDLSKNICNIPKEIWVNIPVDKKGFEELLDNENVENRVMKTLDKQTENIASLRWKYDLLDKSARILCEWLLPELDVFINTFNYEKYKKFQLSMRK